uniref:CCHC-type domain-containing protein n=1 Tax=Branchiostoma floridae TaxID=7739 RepID=C3Z8W2_BRAFL|eukprot:XP_002594983.1 hypothetical protein BRAFLDRAFT_99271 [Branchiostoma floridae]
MRSGVAEGTPLGFLQGECDMVWHEKTHRISAGDAASAWTAYKDLLVYVVWRKAHHLGVLQWKWVVHLIHVCQLYKAREVIPQNPYGRHHIEPAILLLTTVAIVWSDTVWHERRYIDVEALSATVVEVFGSASDPSATSYYSNEGPWAEVARQLKWANTEKHRKRLKQRWERKRSKENCKGCAGHAIAHPTGCVTTGPAGIAGRRLREREKHPFDQDIQGPEEGDSVRERGTARISSQWSRVCRRSSYQPRPAPDPASGPATGPATGPAGSASPTGSARDRRAPSTLVTPSSEDTAAKWRKAQAAKASPPPPAPAAGPSGNGNAQSRLYPPVAHQCRRCRGYGHFAKVCPANSPPPRGRGFFPYRRR